MKYGVPNIEYFHKCINKRRKFNILNLKVNERRLTRVVEIKDSIFENFLNHFSARGVRLISANVNFNRIEGVHNYDLVREFTKEEVQSAVWDCDSSKSLSFDGVNFLFMKEFWEDNKHDFMRIIVELHVKGRMVRGANSSFIVIIPKKKIAVKITNFRPMSLIECIYKVLSKVLANRLKKSDWGSYIRNTISIYITPTNLWDSNCK